MDIQLQLALWTLFLTWLGLGVARLVYNLYFHPLSAYPGPIAAQASGWWKTYIEVIKQESMTDVLLRLHKQFGISYPPLNYVR